MSQVNLSYAALFHEDLDIDEHLFGYISPITTKVEGYKKDLNNVELLDIDNHTIVTHTQTPLQYVIIPKPVVQNTSPIPPPTQYFTITIGKGGQLYDGIYYANIPSG